MSIQIRNYTERDIELVVVLLNAADAVDHMEQGTSLVEKREFLATPDLRPEENVFVAENGDGRLAAVAGLRLFEHDDVSGFRSWFEVHPMYRGRGLEERLLARLQQRAEERLGEVRHEQVYFACSGHTAYVEKLRAIERAGLHEVRRFWDMVRPNLSDLPTPILTSNLVVRTMRVGEDDAEALDALNDSFSEHFGHSETTPESFQHYVHSSLYRPDLTVLAIDPTRERIAGFCHIVVNRGECERLGRQRGWIDILGVRREYRRQGLGEALILQGMHNLRQAGMDEAALGCDSENTTNATRLYFKTGFQVRKTTIAYDKLLRGPGVRAEPTRQLVPVS